MIQTDTYHAYFKFFFKFAPLRLAVIILFYPVLLLTFLTFSASKSASLTCALQDAETPAEKSYGGEKHSSETFQIPSSPLFRVIMTYCELLSMLG